MIVAAHQPHLLPWLGYLAKVAACDLFVVMDDLQYEAQNFQNRNRVKINHGPSWITVPLLHGGRDERICDKRIDNGGSARQHWQHRAWQTLRIHYGAARYWSTYAAELEDVLTRPWTRLVDLDLHLFKLHLEWFEIRKPVLLASSLALSGQKTDRIEALCRAVSATTYLSGRGGSRGYLDEAQLARAGIAVRWQSFQHPIHPQRYAARGFVSHLGAIDCLLNCGPDAARLLRDAMAVSAPLQPAQAAAAAR